MTKMHHAFDPYLHGGGFLDSSVGHGHRTEGLGGRGCLGEGDGADGNSHGRRSSDASHCRMQMRARQEVKREVKWK